jgi:hypothetical protein
VRLSPDGTLVAVASYSLENDSGTQPMSASIYQNGTLLTSLSGWPVGWLDNGRLLINDYATGGSGYDYQGAKIYGPTGTLLATPPIPELRSIQVVTSDLVYVPSLNQILSLSTGARTWASGDPSSGVGAVAGSEVVFVSGSLVLTQPH